MIFSSSSLAIRRICSSSVPMPPWYSSPLLSTSFSPEAFTGSSSAFSLLLFWDSSPVRWFSMFVLDWPSGFSSNGLFVSSAVCPSFFSSFSSLPLSRLLPAGLPPAGPPGPPEGPPPPPSAPAAAPAVDSTPSLNFSPPFLTAPTTFLAPSIMNCEPGITPGAIETASLKPLLSDFPEIISVALFIVVFTLFLTAAPVLSKLWPFPTRPWTNPGSSLIKVNATSKNKM